MFLEISCITNYNSRLPKWYLITTLYVFIFILKGEFRTSRIGNSGLTANLKCLSGVISILQLLYWFSFLNHDNYCDWWSSLGGTTGNNPHFFISLPNGDNLFYVYRTLCSVWSKTVDALIVLPASDKNYTIPNVSTFKSGPRNFCNWFPNFCCRQPWI